MTEPSAWPLAAEDRQTLAVDALEQAKQAVGAGKWEDATRHAARALEIVGTEFGLAVSHWPICPKCQGFAEVDQEPEAPNVLRPKASCVSRPELCIGNGYGRMNPEQYAEWVARQGATRGQVEAFSQDAIRGIPQPIHDSEDGPPTPLPPAIHDSEEGPPTPHVL